MQSDHVSVDNATIFVLNQITVIPRAHLVGIIASREGGRYFKNFFLLNIFVFKSKTDLVCAIRRVHK